MSDECRIVDTLHSATSESHIGKFKSDNTLRRCDIAYPIRPEFMFEHCVTFELETHSLCCLFIKMN